MTAFNRVAVVGAGAWGTALAGVAARAGREVVLCARSPQSPPRSPPRAAIRNCPGSTLDANVKVTDDIGLAATAELILIATPAQNLRAAVAALGPHLAGATPLVACAKGIERGTHKFMTEVIAEAAPEARPAILSGPSFAEDVARGLPTAVTLAASDAELASQLVQALGSATFRPYHTSDVRGVEIGGAAKNVLAIAAGIVGRQEIRRVRAGRADHARLFRTGPARPGLRRAQRNHGGAVGSRRPDPDLLAARNRAISRSGLALGRGEARPRDKLAEGEFTAPVLMELAAARRRRHAGFERGRRHPARRDHDRRRDREPADAAVQGGGMNVRRLACDCPRAGTRSSTPEMEGA